MLTIIETIVAVALLAWIAWTALGIFMRAKLASRMMADPKPYEALTTDYGKTLLILGDSTAVGIGVDMPEETVAAQVAAHIGATYAENQAKSGAAVEDLTTQIQRLHLSHYDLILIQIGGNDILAFHEPKKTAQKLDKILETLPDAGKVILLTAGNVGGATLIPPLVRPLYTFINKRYHKEFEKVAQNKGISYVNLYKKPSEDPFIKDPDRHLSPDGLHPSPEGYKVWFESVKPNI